LNAVWSVFLLALALAAAGVKPMTTFTAKEIRVSLAQPKGVLGGPVVLEATYVNRGSQMLKFRDPAKTWEVMLAIKLPDGSEQRAHFGRIFRRESGGISMQVLEDADDVEIASGATHKFTEDLWQRWPALVRPGRSTLRVVDRTNDAQTATSNAVELFVAFTEESVPRLVDLARDEKASTEARQVAVDWLARLHSGLTLTLEHPTAEQSRANQAALDDFNAWWNANKGGKRTNEAIAQINRDG
jgi:hypothetical protein